MSNQTDIHGRSPVDEQLNEQQHEKYIKAVEENEWKKLIGFFHSLAHTDPSVMYGLRYMTRNQESHFERGAKAYGGSFVRALLRLYQRADPENREKIRKTWPELWIQYVGMGISKSME